MRLDPADRHLWPPLAAKLMQPVAQRFVAQAREFHLVDDEARIGGGFADRIDRRSQALRILLRQRDRHVKHPRRAHQPHAALDDTVLARYRVQQLVLDVDNEKLGLVAVEQHGRRKNDGIRYCGIVGSPSSQRKLKSAKFLPIPWTDRNFPLASARERLAALR